MELRERTARVLDSLNLCELREGWLEEVSEGEFTDAEENRISLSVLFVHGAIPTLTQLAKVCQEWANVDTSDDENALWAVLQEVDIHIKQVQGLIYLLCSRTAKKKDPSLDDRACALAAANLYFSILRVPGSSAYAMFHMNLFFLCIDCLPAPDFLQDKDNTNARLFEKLGQFTVPALVSLEKLLRFVNIGRDSHLVEYAAKKLVEVAACEVHSHVKFETDCSESSTRHQKPTYSVAQLSFKVLLTMIECDLNGDPAENYMYICSQLSKHILCLKARKSQTISQKHHVVKDNCISFILHNLKNKSIQEFCPDVTVVLLKRLCLGVIDKADFRCAVCNSVVVILFSMSVVHVAEMVRWLLQLVDSAETKDRVFALEVLGVMLSHPFPTETDQLQDSAKVYLSEMPIVFAILTRCEDTSPNVRTKALTVLSQNMQQILQFLKKSRDQETFDEELSGEISDRDLDVNGNHRFFWYKFASLRERLNEVAAVLQRRIEDNNVTARKAALAALESLVVFDNTYLTEENLKYFDVLSKDANIVVRKQVMTSLCTILDSYPDQGTMHCCWLRCILPLVQDPENSVQTKALSVLEEQFLQKIFSASELSRRCSFSILRIATSGAFSAYQRYLRKAFGVWKAEKKLRPQLVVQLQKYMDSEWEESVWFYLSVFSSQCTLPPQVSEMCVVQFQKLMEDKLFPSYLIFMLKVLNSMFATLPRDTLHIIKNLMEKHLRELEVPVHLIPTCLVVLSKTYNHLHLDPELKKLSCDLMLTCERHLTDIGSNRLPLSPSLEELLGKCFCTIKEVCQLDESLISTSILSLLKNYAGIKTSAPDTFRILTPGTRAHAFAALGKVCLQDEILAKELLSVYAQELLTSDCDVVRNNLMVVLIEMCKRYTSLADKYVPLISLCLRDKLFLIRYQTVKLLLNLLQEGYIKWRGPLFFCLLSTLNDRKEEIQELGRYSLSSLLNEKKKTLFSEHFVDSIFVFNGFPPPDNTTLAQTVTDLDRFAIKGDCGREGRMHLYKFLLESMDVKERAYLVKSICEILMNVAETVYPLNQVTECIVRDCFAILTCKEIRAFNVDQISEDVDEAQEREFSKTELDTRRIVIVDPVIPVIVSLKAAVSDPASDLTQDIIVFLKELLLDFKDSLKDILGTDKVLLQTLELEMRNDAERERAEKRDSRERRQHRTPTGGSQREEEDAHGIKSMMNNVSNFLQDAAARGSSNPSPSFAGGSQQSRTVKPVDRNSQKDSGSSQPQLSSSASTSCSVSLDMRILSSTPRVVLRPLKLPGTSKSLNVSAILNSDQRDMLDISDSDMQWDWF